jgi:uncharacterized protein (TIGR03000 family)
MVRQWFSISAVLAMLALMVASDSSQGRERRLLRRFRGYNDNAVMTNVPTTEMQTVAVRQRGNGRRYRAYPESQLAMGPQTEFRRSFYVAPGQPAPVYLTLRVPPQADILIDGEKTIQKGAVRQYVSPPVATDGKFSYEITAKWTDDGKPLSQTRKVAVRGGQEVTVDLRKPMQEKK